MNIGPGHKLGCALIHFVLIVKSLGIRTDSCPEEVHCSICHVAGHMAAFTIWSTLTRTKLLIRLIVLFFYMFLEATGLVLIFATGFLPFVMVLLLKFF